jgi:hypothetical protein
MTQEEPRMTPINADGKNRRPNVSPLSLGEVQGEGESPTSFAKLGGRYFAFLNVNPSFFRAASHLSRSAIPSGINIRGPA